MAKKSMTIEATIEAEPMPLEVEESQKALDGILDGDWSSPIALKMGRNYFSSKNPAYRYYETISPKLAGWWDEFSTALDPKDGGPKYKTIHQFAKTKSTVEREQQWIVQMIGPEPAAFNWKCKDEKRAGKWLRVPWLGDWRARRLNGYWAPEHPAKIKSLIRSIKEKLNGFEAVQSATPLLVQMMARYTRLGEQIDQVFGGQALDVNAGPSEANKTRFYAYLEMQKAVTRVQLRLLHEWMLAHGVSVNGQPVQLTQVNNMLVQAGQSPAGTADALTSKQLESLKLARMLQMHADNFEMPLPAESAPKKEPEKVENIKGNGKAVM